MGFKEEGKWWVSPGDYDERVTCEYAFPEKIEILDTTLRDGEQEAGIILTTAAQEKPDVYEVIVVGPGGLVDGNEVKMEVKKGDQVIFSKYAGTEVKLDGEDLILVSQKDILAVVK